MDAYLPLVRRVVRQLARRLPANVQRDDLIAAGIFGLVDSLRRNGGDGGAAFDWYARTRIRGAIFDELRAQDWLSRRARAARGEAEASFVSFEDVAATTTSPASPAATTRRRPSSPRSQSRALARALERLPERERTVVARYYFEGRQAQGHRRRAGRERAAHLAAPRAGPRAAAADAHRGRSLIAPGGRHGETGGRHPGAPLHPRESPPDCRPAPWHEARQARRMLQLEGRTVPPPLPVTSAPPSLLSVLKRTFGFGGFRPLQEEIIRDALAGPRRLRPAADGRRQDRSAFSSPRWCAPASRSSSRRSSP